MADVGYVAVQQSANWEHTPVDKFFYHDGKWWGLFHNGSVWALYSKDASDPASPGDTGGWTSHLTLTGVNQSCSSVALDAANNRAWVIGFQASGATVVMRRLDYSSGSWSVGLSFNLVNSSGVGLGTSSTFKNSNGKLSIAVDPNGVPYVVAGNKGNGAQATNGVHFAWPDSAAAINGTWSFVTIDSDLVTEGDASGKIAGFFSQGGTTYVVVCYSADNGTDKHKFAYHAVETTLANYASGWTIVDQDATKDCDNHIWGGVFEYGGDTVICTIGKDANSRIWLFTSQLGPGLTWTHKIHRVTNGSGDFGPLVEDASRGVGVMDTTNGEFYVFYQRSQSNPEGSIDYKKATLAALLAATTETEVFDTTAADNGTPIILDESVSRMANPHGPSHPVTAAMGFFPVGCNINGATTPYQWWNKIAIAAAGFTGTGSATLPSLNASASGTFPYRGAAAATLPSLAGVASGALTFTGAGAATLPSLTASAAGSFAVVGQFTGTGAATLPSLAGAATGQVKFTGQATTVLPSLIGNAIGWAQVTGTGAASLPSLTANGAGIGNPDFVPTTRTVPPAGGGSDNRRGARRRRVPYVLPDGRRIRLYPEEIADLVARGNLPATEKPAKHRDPGPEPEAASEPAPIVLPRVRDRSADIERLMAEARTAGRLADMVAGMAEGLSAAMAAERAAEDQRRRRRRRAAALLLLQ